LGATGRYRSNVLDYPGVNTFNPNRRRDLELHPTVKPVALIADLIRDCSKRNGIILDPCSGSGVTVLAAERTGRVARLMEIDPLYVDVTIRRWEKAYGKPALLSGTNQTFADAACARLADTEDSRNP
jgi:DNA modification methylase